MRDLSVAVYSMGRMKGSSELPVMSARSKQYERKGQLHGFGEESRPPFDGFYPTGLDLGHQRDFHIRSLSYKPSPRFHAYCDGRRAEGHERQND